MLPAEINDMRRNENGKKFIVRPCYIKFTLKE